MVGDCSLHHHNQLLRDVREAWYPWNEKYDQVHVVDEDEWIPEKNQSSP